MKNKDQILSPEVNSRGPFPIAEARILILKVECYVWGSIFVCVHIPTKHKRSGDLWAHWRLLAAIGTVGAW